MTFSNLGVRKSGLRARRLLCGFTALSSCALALGCGAPPDAGMTTGSGTTASSSEPVQEIQEALSVCPNPVMCTANKFPAAATTSKTKQILMEAKDIFSIAAALYSKSPGSIASSVFQFVQDNFFATTSPDLEGDINCLSQEIECVAQGLDWKVTDIAWEDDQYVPVSSALMDMATGFTAGSADDVLSHNGTSDSGKVDMFSRIYVPAATDGDGKWKDIIANSAPDATGNGQVFDWQGGFTRFTTLIPRRLAIIGYLDPNFQADGTRSQEIDGTEGYRPTLQSWLKKMESGVHCDWKDRGGDGTALEARLGRYFYTDLACADVNSGLSAEGKYTIPDASNCLVCQYPPNGGICATDLGCLQSQPSYTIMTFQSDPLARVVKSQLPIFEVHAMIDDLYRITHPASDLTEAQGRITVTANRGLCLDVQWGNSASGTPVWIWGCNGTGAQQWSYDRHATTIKNTAFGKCLQVRQVNGLPNRQPGAVAEISDCVTPVPPRQQWTYDPEKGFIRSALGTVLDIQQNNQQAGTPVVLMDDYEHIVRPPTEQSWYADQTSAYCTNACNGMCPSTCNGSCAGSCSGAGPNIGQCIGACMGSCMGACMPQCVNQCM